MSADAVEVWVISGVAGDSNETAPIVAACATRELAGAAVERMLGPDVEWHRDSLGFDLTDSDSYLLGRVQRMTVISGPSGLLALAEFEPSPSDDDTSDDDDEDDDDDLADAVARYGWTPEADPGLVALHARATHALQVQEQEDEARRAERRAWLDSVGGWPPNSGTGGGW